MAYLFLYLFWMVGARYSGSQGLLLAQGSLLQSEDYLRLLRGLYTVLATDCLSIFVSTLLYGVGTMAYYSGFCIS